MADTVIFFDFDDTLADLRRAARKASEATLPVMQQHVKGLPLAAWSRALDASWLEAWPRYVTGELAEDELQHAFIRGALERCEQETLSDRERAALLRSFYEAFTHSTQPYDDVNAVLPQLAAHYRLGIITNGPERQQQERVLHSGVGQHVDAVIVSGGCGYFKPDQRLFETAASALGLTRSERVLMVGDSPWEDMSGARAMGWHTVWINRRSRSWPEELEPPDLEISNLRQLQPWLTTLN